MYKLAVSYEPMVVLYCLDKIFKFSTCITKF